MSVNLQDELSEQESFSIAKIDETIARSKRIVQESLAMSKNSHERHVFRNHSSYDSHEDIEDSLKFDLDQINRKSESPIQFESKFEKRSQIPRNSQVTHEQSFYENKKLKELENADIRRNREIIRLQNILKNRPNPDVSELEKELLKKKNKIRELSQQVTENEFYKENQEIREKIKQYESINTETNVKARIKEERLLKESLEGQYNNLYQSHQQKAMENEAELKKIKEDIRVKEKENQKTIRFLTNKLEEKVLDSKLIHDQIRLTPDNFNKNHQFLTYYTTRETKGRKNSKSHDDTSEHVKKIFELETELKKYKMKYKQLKKLYLKKCRRSSVELKKNNFVTERIKRKSNSKRKMSKIVN